MTTQITSNRLYPGMIDNGIEFFVVDNDGEKLKVLQGQKIFDFEELSFSVIQMIKEEIEKNPIVQEHLLLMQPDSEFKRLKQFIACRFGGIDTVPDFLNGSSVEGDYWECPLRGNCQSEGIVCKAVKWQNKTLTPTEVKLMKLTVSSKTNETIADELNMAMGTFHQVKKFLYEKLGVQTKQEVAIIAMVLNLI